MAMGTATRLLLRSFRRPAGHLHRSPSSPPPPILLPNIRRGPSSPSPPRRRGILVGMLCFVSATANVVFVGLDDVVKVKPPPSPPKATLLLDWDDGNKDWPPTRPHVLRNKRPVTDALIALHLIVHGVDVATNRKLNMWGTKNNALIRKGQLWRLATSSVLHGGIFHITMNMLALDDFGSLMEEVSGPARFLAIYCTSAIAGSLMSYRFTPGNSVGASDAICGLIGAQGVYTWRRRESLTSARDTFKEIRDIILFSLVFSLALRRVKCLVDNWAHLGGFLGGAAVELFLGPHGKQHVASVTTMALEDSLTNEQ